VLKSGLGFSENGDPSRRTELGRNGGINDVFPGLSVIICVVDKESDSLEIVAGSVGSKMRVSLRELSLTSPKLKPRARTLRVEIPGITDELSESTSCVEFIPRLFNKLSPRRLPRRRLPWGTGAIICTGEAKRGGGATGILRDGGWNDCSGRFLGTGWNGEASLDRDG
jgi:hypothetical protein